MKQKAFFIIFEGLSLNEIFIFLLEVRLVYRRYLFHRGQRFPEKKSKMAKTAVSKSP